MRDLNYREFCVELKNSQIMKLIEDYAGKDLRLEERWMRISRMLEGDIHVSITDRPDWKTTPDGKMEKINHFDLIFIFDDFEVSTVAKKGYLSDANESGWADLLKPGFKEAYEELLINTLQGEQLDKYYAELEKRKAEAANVEQIDPS